MKAVTYRWDQVSEDQPIERLHRRMVRGREAMVARIRVEKGCFVQAHSHPMEQISLVVSGRTRWLLDSDQYEHFAGPGDVIVLPGGCRHAMEALEDSELIDVISPPGAMGVDSQSRS